MLFAGIGVVLDGPLMFPPCHRQGEFRARKRGIVLSAAGRNGAAGGTSETASTERVYAMREASYPLKTVSSSFLPNRFAGFAGNLRCQQNKPLIMQSNAHDKGRLCFYR